MNCRSEHKIFKRNCPDCGTELSYKRKSHADSANALMSKCYCCANKKSSFIPIEANGLYGRSCNSCNLPMFYKNKVTCVISEKRNKKCRSCSAKKRLNKKESLKDIGPFKRECPSCKKELLYKREGSLINADKKNCKCSNCANSASKKRLNNGAEEHFEDDSYLKYKFVYQTKNLINGKTYIGVRCTNNLNDGYIGCGVTSQKSAIMRAKKLKSPFIHAVVKYGYENFKKEYLGFYETKKEAYNEEAFLVNKEWVISKNNYNASLGGVNPKIISKYSHLEKEWAELYANGFSMNQISKMYGMSSHASISLALKKIRKNKETNQQA